MARTNTAVHSPQPQTHEGAPAHRINDKQQLRRTVMSCMLWEDEFYEDGVSIAQRIASLAQNIEPTIIAETAIEARDKMKLRHVPLLIASILAKRGYAGTADLLEHVIQRADELAEFASIHAKVNGVSAGDIKKVLSAQIKKGLARAFTKFDEYQIAKYNRDGGVKLRDVLFLSHPKPKDEVQKEVWKRLVAGTLAIPDTWETTLSTGKDKKASWERLISEEKLGALAFLRNLRNMKEANVSRGLIVEGLAKMKVDRVLPFRFIAAAKYAPHLEPEIEAAMLRALTLHEKLPGRTALVIDNSGSMHGCPISARSEMDRFEAAAALAILVREVCEDVVVIGFGTDAMVMPSRRGFALRDSIRGGPGGGTDTRKALMLAANEGYDRVIVVTDEQSHTTVVNPLIGTKGYFINVASNQNGIGYGQWTHIDGWSEAVIDYIREFERTE